MTDGSSTLVSSVTYGPAGEVLHLRGSAVFEDRTYNSMGQLTQLTGNGMSVSYAYFTGNNGQILSQTDSGETIVYTYDSLKRLSTASSTQGWTQGFTYDGFGNLTAKSAVSGNPPVGTYPVDPTTNRLTSGNYDANGNYGAGGPISSITYDVSNRLTQANGKSIAK